MPNNNQISNYTANTLPSISLSEVSEPGTLSILTEISNVSLTLPENNFLTLPASDYAAALTLRSLSLQEKNSDNFIQDIPSRERWLSAPSEISSELIGVERAAEMSLSMPESRDLMSLMPASAEQCSQSWRSSTHAERMRKQKDVPHSVAQNSSSLPASGQASATTDAPTLTNISPALVIKKLDKNQAPQIDINKISFTANIIRHANFYQLNFSKLNNQISERKLEQLTKNKHAVVITGYSGLSYNKQRTNDAASDWERVQDTLRMIYDNAVEKHGKEKIVIICGGTSDDGICDLSADIAAEKKLRIFGIASSQAVNYQCLSAKYTMVFVINGETWEVPGSDGVSLFAKMAVSNALLNRTGELHAIEGGEVTVSELNAARASGVEPNLHLGYAADPEQIKKRTKPGFDPHPVRTWYNANKR